MEPCKNTAKKVLSEWSHHEILSTDSKVKTTLHVSIVDSGSKRVNQYGLWHSSMPCKWYMNVTHGHGLLFFNLELKGVFSNKGFNLTFVL